MKNCKIIKSGGHCYDGCAWNECSFWKHTKISSKCMLFGGAGVGIEKTASEALVICNKIYGENYEGEV